MPLLNPRRTRTVRRTARLHPAQAAFRHHDALYRGFVGGRGSGKSWAGAYDLLRRCRPGRTYLVASPTGILLGDTTFPTFKALALHLGTWRGVKLTPYPNVRIACGKGQERATIRFRTAEDPERLRGPNLSGVWLDEASLMPKAAYDVAIAALREAGEQGWLSATFTPKGLGHWTYEVFGSQPPRPNTAICHARTRDNPFIPPEFQATLEGQYSGVQARQELDGAFCNIEGAEWPADFFDGILFSQWPSSLTHRVIALDPSKGRADRPGDYSAFVMLGLDEDWRLWADADMDNTRPVESPQGGRSIVSDGMNLYQWFSPQALSVETNGFQELVAAAFLRVAQERRLHLPLYGVCSTSPKTSRIRALGTYLAQRRLRIRDTPGGRLLLQQIRDFPEGAHDDGPDGLAQAVRMLDRLLGAQGGADRPELYREHA